jgi:hypothetical protein
MQKGKMQQPEDAGQKKKTSVKLALLIAVVALGWYVVSMIVIWNQ